MLRVRSPFSARSCGVVLGSFTARTDWRVVLHDMAPGSGVFPWTRYLERMRFSFCGFFGSRISAVVCVMCFLGDDCPILLSSKGLGRWYAPMLRWEIYFFVTVDCNLIFFLGQVQIFDPIGRCYFAGILYHIGLYIIHSC